jgi:hypothetical protein
MRYLTDLIAVVLMQTLAFQAASAYEAGVGIGFVYIS